ncbi:GNAT family N-acetyltransferase [Serratia sp. M24T3]|uniref:GNAT family N-acetyltransferase n=1 Tax=Serratia sp. M24T3 TaxID=932213 RepID=UPI00025BB627|nr:GNAT family protein [Serratia sp. M24T3]EIC83621.1 GNAT family acetyltransferase [Serratia sp. M24T3]
MTSENWLQEITLPGKTVTLIPLRSEHAEELGKVCADGELWKLWYTSVPTKSSVESYIATALKEQQAGASLPFAVMLNATRQIVGTTRFCRADNQHHRVEIGFTWYAKSVQKTAVNTECKYLLLQHAFEQLAAIAVEFRTHWHNHTSRAAIARLGAKQDGVLRNMQKDPDGACRDTVIFSIIDSEWPTVKKSLNFKMGQYPR